ncbi:hypothetical protein C5167_042434 [Papaver somniferum]|uniref:Uncharacterized protein n=1 Tax=Papaver somniferum TaxID=3469 RepID=A0A4Y7L3U7_PAPSO|nr:hypothetical protein C5167_042434 [Papaver somniferum]
MERKWNGIPWDYYFHIMHPSCKVNHQALPKHPPSYMNVTEEYTKEVLRVNFRILGLLSVGLSKCSLCAYW